MKSSKEIEIEKKLDEIMTELLGNARTLVEVSRHDVSEEVLQPLQEKQERLILDLKIAQESLVESYDITEGLKRFIELNTQYVENLARGHGVIGLKGQKD